MSNTSTLPEQIPCSYCGCYHTHSIDYCREQRNRDFRSFGEPYSTEPKCSIKIKYTIDEQTMRECMARAYCRKENETKELDSTLIQAMIQEIKYACCNGGG
jgi:hypothetical protein